MMFDFFTSGVTLPTPHETTWTYGPGIHQLEAANAVIAAARAYADFTHGNLTGARYKARLEARDALLDALEAFDALGVPATLEMGVIGCDGQHGPDGTGCEDPSHCEGGVPA